MNNTQKILSILCAPIQRLENVMQDVLTQRYLSNAVGAQLEVLGKLVGQARGGLADDDYRRYIGARILTNRATGRREELIKIARVIINDSTARVVIRRRAIATIELTIVGIAVPASVETALVNFLTSAVGNGIRIIVRSAPALPGLMFKFAGGVTGPGFDNYASPGNGGKLADGRDGNTA